MTFTGRVHSEETRKNMSQAHTGLHHSRESRKKMSEAHEGKHHSEETRRKMSEAHKGKVLLKETRRKMSEAKKELWRDPQRSEEARRKHSESIRGENHWNWKGGRIPYYGPDWHQQRRLARERDNYTCLCGLEENGREHDVHHIVPYRIGRDNSQDNLWTLCPKCHRKIEVIMEAS